jgi:hypothetical protein
MAPERSGKTVYGLLKLTLTWYDPPRISSKEQEENTMEFFTAFYIEYAINGRDIQTYIILPSYEACQVFIRDNEDMSEYMFADGDVDMWCLDTGVISKSIRPVLRPQS